MNLFASAPLIFLADPGDWGHMDGWGWGMAVFGWLFMGLIVVLVGWLIWSTTQGGSRKAPPGNAALGILDERYARGEVERDEYLRRRNDLQK